MQTEVPMKRISGLAMLTDIFENEKVDGLNKGFRSANMFQLRYY